MGGWLKKRIDGGGNRVYFENLQASPASPRKGDKANGIHVSVGFFVLIYFFLKKVLTMSGEGCIL
jgi:hypothetical protein